jgi:hypothetical protein
MNAGENPAPDVLFCMNYINFDKVDNEMVLKLNKFRRNQVLNKNISGLSTRVKPKINLHNLSFRSQRTHTDFYGTKGVRSRLIKMCFLGRNSGYNF